jgi:hypothetical protein
MRSLLQIVAVVVVLPTIAHSAPADYFGIRVVDQETGRGIPLVELRTTYKARYYTDSAGYVAFLEPGLMDQEVWFDVASYGYDSPKGPIGTHGIALKIAPGTTTEIKLHRNQIAERLYRMTGYGTYRDSTLLGISPPIDRDLLPGQVTGQDSVQTAIYRGRMYWLWQDTDRLSFALGNFSMTGATSALPEKLDPERGIEFKYFVRQPYGFVKPFALVKREGNNPIWVDGIMVVKDAARRERMLGRYVAANPDYSFAEIGLVLYDDEKNQFDALKKLEKHEATRLYPSGHPCRVQAYGNDYYYFSNPFPCARVMLTFEAASDFSAYEGFTCLTPGSVFQNEKSSVNRDADGKLVWTWQRRTEPIGPDEFEALVEAGLTTAEESPFQIKDVETGKPVRVHNGSVAWNPYLKAWVFLFGQRDGDSFLGEIWLATASAPEGPWTAARKVATHARPGNNNDLYNPMQHPELAGEDGKILYFQGTFVNTFSGNPSPTPYYDYNQLMYRVDLSDDRLKLPTPPAGFTDSRPSAIGP